MSRARNIKPGFFRNEMLAECQPLARILFAGLWCEADREGRLEDRPKRLKADCLPYDECDAHELLDELADRDFITRYVVGGKRFIQINEFAKHQNPHQKEAGSTIPAPEKHSACPVQETTETGTSHADSLIPDSPSQKKRVASQPRVSGLVLPEWLSAEAWADWHTFRNSRKGWTRKAQELSLRTLTKLRRKGHDPTSVIEQSIESGWTGLFELRDGSASRGTRRENLGEGAAGRVARLCAEQDAAERGQQPAGDFFEGEYRPR